MTGDSFIVNTARKLLEEDLREASTNDLRDWGQVIYGLISIGRKEKRLGQKTLNYFDYIEEYFYHPEFEARKNNDDSIRVGKWVLNSVLMDYGVGKYLKGDGTVDYYGS